MLKKLLSGSILLHIVFLAAGQVRESRVSIDTVYRSALYMESDMNESNTKDAIESYFDSLNITREKGKGFIIKKSMGYMLFRRARVDYLSDMVDIYFVVNDKKLKNGDASTVYIAASKGNNFLTPENDAQYWGMLREYASYIQANFFEQYKINKEMTTVNKGMEKQKKKLQELEKEKLELENSISSDSTRVASLLDQLLKLKEKKQ